MRGGSYFPGPRVPTPSGAGKGLLVRDEGLADAYARVSLRLNQVEPPGPWPHWCYQDETDALLSCFAEHLL